MILPRAVLLSTLLLGILAFVATTQRNTLLGMLDIATTTTATVSSNNATYTAATAAAGADATLRAPVAVVGCSQAAATADALTLR